ncbi:MAG: YihY family inner membrane protein [Candidatus Omnitrophica bacterium]|nr:YihY family inner membrane protein [Candidatus Omnitrophota bacterium]MDE2222011.1 YihY family inner membrane protein [Candidatus Omnitrophota bacterium]
MPSSIKQIVDFLNRDIWRIPARKLPRKHFFLIMPLRVILLAIREFRGKQCQLNASALTFYTLISIVPIVAMAFGIAKGFGLDRTLEAQLLQKFPGQEATITQIIGFANNLLKNTSGGIVAGIGVMVLFWTVIKVLNSIETSFNDIWGIKTERPFGRKVSDYLSIMLICPFLVISSGGITVFLAGEIELIVQKLAFLGPLASMILLSLHILPYIMLWALFTFLYLFMPNTKVNFLSGLIGGVMAGTIYQLVQIIYIHFQIGVANMNAIYGSFAALPLFLVWLQLSWRVVLFGAEVSFAHQNVDTYEFEHDCVNVSHSFKRLLSLLIASFVVKRFAAGKPPVTAGEITDSQDIPIRLVREVLFELSQAGVLAEFRDATGRQAVFQPAKDINDYTVQSVLDAMDKKGTDKIPVVESAQLKKLNEILGKFAEQAKSSPGNKLLKDI